MELFREAVRWLGELEGRKKGKVRNEEEPTLERRLAGKG